MEARATLIPNFLKATSPIGLRGLMLENNIRLGAQVNYFSIQYVGKEWFAWFYEEFDFTTSLNEAGKPNKKGK